MNWLLKTFLFLFVLTQTIEAKLTRVPYEGVRPLGMGNAFIGISNDSNALFYNPAGLARIEGTHFNLINFNLGVDSRNTLSRLYDAVFDGKYSQIIRTDTQYTRATFIPTLISRYFGFAIYDHLTSFTDIRNLTAETIDLSSSNDLGAILGVGIPFGEYFSLGFSVRAIQRSALDVHISVIDLITQIGVPQQDFLNAAYNHLKRMAGTGWGIGLNMGAIFRVPLMVKNPKLLLAGTVEDAGQTSFKKIGNNTPPPPIRPSYHLGAAVQYSLNHGSELNLAFDTRNVFESIPLIKMLHVGLEYRHKLFSLRAGSYQIYPTFGFSIQALPHTHIHFSSYAVELGNSPLQRSQRRYELQLVIGFRPI